MDSLFICDLNLQTGKYSKPLIVYRTNDDFRSPGHLLIDHSVEMVLAGGIHCSTISALENVGIDCCVGMQGKTPKDVLRNFILQPDRIRTNACPSAIDPAYHCDTACWYPAATELQPIKKSPLYSQPIMGMMVSTVIFTELN